MSTPLPVGWWKPADSRKYHYFGLDGIRSLCGGWGALPPADEIEDTNHHHPANCAACQKVLAKRQALTKRQAAADLAAPGAREGAA